MAANQGARGQRAPAVALVLLLLHAFVYSGCGEDEIGGRGVSGRGAVGRIIWMMQGKHELDLSYLRGEHSDAIQVVWGAPPSGTYADTHFLPNSTCTEGRNFLLQLAFEKGVARGEQYLYFIYTEDDAELEEIIDFGHSMGDPYRTFESYLRKYVPAVGFPFNGYGFPDTPDQEVVATCWWDHLMVAFHRDALQALLPYWTGMDVESWWFSQRIVTVLAAAHFHPFRLQFNALAAMNTEHRWNPEMGEVDWGACNSWLMPAISGQAELSQAVCAFDNDHVVPPAHAEYANGHALYSAQQSFAARQGSVDACHPLSRSQRHFWDTLTGARAAKASSDLRLWRTHEYEVLTADSSSECGNYSVASGAHDQAFRLGGLAAAAGAPWAREPAGGRGASLGQQLPILDQLKQSLQVVLEAARLLRPERLTITRPLTRQILPAADWVPFTLVLSVQGDGGSSDDASVPQARHSHSPPNSYSIKVYEEVALHQKQPRLLAESVLACRLGSRPVSVSASGHRAFDESETMASSSERLLSPAACRLDDRVQGLTVGQRWLKFDVLRSDGTKAASDRVAVSVAGPEQSGEVEL